jgi:hypothetical protein
VWRRDFEADVREGDRVVVVALQAVYFFFDGVVERDLGDGTFLVRTKNSRVRCRATELLTQTAPQ